MKKSFLTTLNTILNRKTYLALAFTLPVIASAQKKVTNQDLLWYGYYLTAKIGDKTEFLGEIQERHYINPSAQHQLIFRGNIRYKLIRTWKVSGGMTYFLQSPNDPKSDSYVIVPELRPDIGIETKQKFNHFSLSHRFKAEARFFHNVDSENDRLERGYSFGNFRFRYQFGIDVPIAKFENLNKSELVLKLRDEVMLNAGPAIDENTFDQNRISGSVYYKLNKNIALELGYMNWYQRRATGHSYYDRDIIRFSFHHTL